MNDTPNCKPIGVFDSGAGGLSVVRHIREQLPAENISYVADSAFVPYGDKPTEFILSRALAIAEFFVSQSAKAMVVACNTATAAAIHELRAHYDFPVVGMEPGVKPAAAATRTGHVGVLATSATVGSHKFATLLAKHHEQATVHVQACPGLVDLIERGITGGPQVDALLKQYVSPLLAQGVDTLVLGCTHYPFILESLRALVGESVQIVDTGPAVARQLAKRLAERNLLAAGSTAGKITYWTSGDPGVVSIVFSALLGESATVASLPR